MLGNSIKKYRMENGLTQKELAKRLVISQNAISQYEKGKRAPTVKKLADISKLLGCPVDALIAPEVDMSNNGTATTA